MKQYLIGALALLCVACHTDNVPTDSILLQGTYAGGAVADLQLSLRPLGGSSYTDAQLVADSADTFSILLPQGETGFYSLYGVFDGGQISLPMYLPKGGKRYDVQLHIEDGAPLVQSDKDNKALSAYNKFIYQFGRDFWMNGQDIPVAQLESYIRRYQTVADSIVKAFRCSTPVKEYIQLWATTSMENLYGSLPRAIGVKHAELPFTEEQLLAGATDCYKSPIASCFPSVTYSIVGMLPKGTLTEKLTYLHTHYTYPGTQMRVTEAVMSNFIGRFNYESDYEAGLDQLNAAITQFGLDENYAKEFAKRRASAKGAPFPTDVTLTDINGNTMDIAIFKGSYVYIDLWASWCVPCCREVPHLQKLEKELKNPNVKFLSVSIDTNAEAWKKKLKDLNMHGHQWLNQDNSLGNAYNVRGIPYFLIIDKEGRLYMPNAPRPSHPELRTLLENLK